MAILTCVSLQKQSVIIFVTMKKWLLLISVFFLLGSFGTQGLTTAEAQQSNLIYVANTQDLCSGYTNCFFNDSTDLPQSNALMKAIKFARDNSLAETKIYVLSPYEINSHAIQVNYPVSIIGKNDGWISTSNEDCSQPMFVISARSTIRDIHLTDGTCNSPSRDLLVINSASPVLIEHNTLENGQTAISFESGAGQLTVQFNHINNNQTSIINTNSDPAAKMLVVANNITSTSPAAQVTCQRNSFVDHNYWGQGVMPGQSAPGCGADDAKRLDAPIVTETTGVAARLLSLTNTFPSTDFYGFKASSPNPSELYVVNHGSSAPFSSSAGNPYVCSNYFDVFLPSSSSPDEITLSFTYQNTSDCAPIIQSAAYCGFGNQTRFPLLWYDPQTRVTDKWDKTGDKPQSTSGNIYAGQETTCRTSSRTIEVIVDNNGRPNLLDDMHFTPFVIGFEQAGVLSFTSAAVNNTINLNWSTVTEVNTLKFYISRSTTSDGTYEKISEDIAAKGSPSSGDRYTYADLSATVGQTYYYKLVVIDTDGSVQQMVGPISASVTPQPSPTHTSTPTATKLPTRTVTPTRTQTPFLTATSAFKTGLPKEPTLFLSTITDTPILEFTPDLSSTPEGTPTPGLTPSRTPTSTISGTPNSGSLGKTDRYSGQKQVPFYLGGVAVLILISLLAVYIHREK